MKYKNNIEWGLSPHSFFLFFIIIINDLVINFFKQISDINSITLEKGGYLIFANAFSGDTSCSITGYIKDGEKTISKTTSSGVPGYEFGCGISLCDYIYILNDETITFDVICSANIDYKNISAFKILK